MLGIQQVSQTPCDHSSLFMVGAFDDLSPQLKFGADFMQVCRMPWVS